MIKEFYYEMIMTTLCCLIIIGGAIKYVLKHIENHYPSFFKQEGKYVTVICTNSTRPVMVSVKIENRK